MRVTILILVLIGCLGCNDNYIPKPRGYHRIELPAADYTHSNIDCPYNFDINRLAQITAARNTRKEDCQLNIHYPTFNATVHLTYLPVDSNLRKLSEDARRFVYKHTIKADDIDEKLTIRDSSRVYGITYELEGNAATAMQFYMTDSSNHFVRGALYFNTKTNADSLRPVAKYIKKDIFQFINTLSWK